MANCARMRPDRSVRRRWPMANRSAPNRVPAILRCGIYTRKSSEEGLDQDFNSLDAQREACEAFIASQKREGWVLIDEIFDKHAVSFVSVTQQFNTTTSMGRLTLNILLSFAQFEREVTGERIRDKIAASK